MQGEFLLIGHDFFLGDNSDGFQEKEISCKFGPAGRPGKRGQGWGPVLGMNKDINV